MIINGFEKNIELKQCKRCVNDTRVPGISFDKNGICQYCKIHSKMEKDYPNDPLHGKAQLHERVRKIKSRAKGKKYDCVVGLSGGRDSCYLLYLAVKEFGLRPLAVHFNDGFDNPVAGENMTKLCRFLDVSMRTITSNWKLARDLKLMELQASTPQLNTGTDVGIASTLYGVAYKEKIPTILFGQSFRTEGIKPLSWAYFEGDYLKAIHNEFGKIPMPKWSPSDPGYSLGAKELAYYILKSGIRVEAPLYNYPYIRSLAEETMKNEFDWVYPGGHYYDDLYWSLIVHIHRVKFNIDLRINSYSALVRDGQMDRDEAKRLLQENYVIEDPDVIRLCLKRLGLEREEFDKYIDLPPKHFTDYPNNYSLLKRLKWPISLLCNAGFLPKVVYDKWFMIGTGVENF